MKEEDKIPALEKEIIKLKKVITLLQRQLKQTNSRLIRMDADIRKNTAKLEQQSRRS